MSRKYFQFLKSINSFDDYSDAATKTSFWDLDLEPLDSRMDNRLWIMSVSKAALKMYIENKSDVEKAIEMMEKDYSYIREDEYPEIYKYNFTYKSKLTGFAACQHYGYNCMMIPFIELSGDDAETIISTMTLIS
jgi:hypothetical protein